MGISLTLLRLHTRPLAVSLPSREEVEPTSRPLLAEKSEKGFLLVRYVIITGLRCCLHLFMLLSPCEIRVCSLLAEGQ